MNKMEEDAKEEKEERKFVIATGNIFIVYFVRH